MNVRATSRTRDMLASPCQTIPILLPYINKDHKSHSHEERKRYYKKTRAHHVLGRWSRAAYTPSGMMGTQKTAKIGVCSFWKKAKLWRQ